MADEQMDSADTLLKKFLPQSACAGSAVEQDDGSVTDRSSTQEVLPP
jgi:hypothetical protein